MLNEPEDDDHDDSNHRDATDDESPPLHPKDVANELLDRFDRIDSPEQRDWYQSLLAVATDQHEGDMEKAMQQADSIFAEHPQEPEESSQEALPTAVREGWEDEERDAEGRWVTCTNCQRTGGKDVFDETLDCPRCGGGGRAPANVKIGCDRCQQHPRIMPRCQTCHGTGMRYPAWEPNTPEEFAEQKEIDDWNEQSSQRIDLEREAAKKQEAKKAAEDWEQVLAARREEERKASFEAWKKRK